MGRLTSIMQRARDRVSIRHQSAVLTALLCLATVAAVAVTTISIVRHAALANATRDIGDLARAMADKLDRQMFERHREIANIAALEALRETFGNDTAGTRSLLHQLQTSLSDYTWIGYATADGRVRSATKSMLEGVSVAERPWFKAGLAGPAVVDLHEAKLLVALLGPSEDGDAFRFVDVAAPVRDRAGAVMGVLGAHLSWTWAKTVRDDLLSVIDPALETELWVAADDGTVILGSDFGRRVLPETVLAIPRGDIHVFDETIDGRRILAAAVETRGLGPYQGLGWRVIARRPADIALADANRLTLVILAIGSLAALIAMGAAFAIAGHVTTPLRKLTEDADRIGRDPGMVLVARQRGSTEVIRLSNVLRSLIRRVDFAEASLGVAWDRAARTERQRASEAETHKAMVEGLVSAAETDPLTELPNRRGFLRFAREAHQAFRRQRDDFGIVMIDIDHFKQVNDRFGHLTGDVVIRSVGRTLAEAAGPTTRVGRFGGEEFVALLREADEAAIEAWAERVRLAVEALVIDAAGEALRITVSAGATRAVSGDRDIEDIIQRADTALYAAKARGRNKVIVLRGETPHPIEVAA